MDVSSIAGATGALVAGVSGSLHCALMCGPLACAVLPRDGERKRAPVVAYQLGRVTAYTAVGAGLGLVGTGVVKVLAASVQPYLPWVMAAALIATALDVGKHLRPIPGIAQIARGLARLGAKFSPTVRAGALGAATPFLPCGLLYGVMIAAIATGSVLGGAAVMGAFSLGGLPALTVTQLQGRWLSRKPKLSLVMRRVIPVAAAVVLVWRALVVGAAPVVPENAADASPPVVHHCH